MDDMDDLQFKGWLRRPTLMAANGLFLLAAAGMIVVQVLILWIAGALFPSASSSDLFSVSSVILELGLLLLPTLLYALPRPGVHLAMRLNPPSLKTMIYAVLSAVAAVLFMNSLGSLWAIFIEALGGRLLDTGVEIPTNSSELMRSVLLVGVLPGVCEEVLFRGALMGAWERRGTKYALVVTSVLFFSMHASLQALPVHLAMGFVLGYVAISADSLYVSMLYHTVFNTSLVTLSYFSTQLTTEATVEAGASIFDSIGGMPGVITLAINTLIMGVLFFGSLTLFAGERRSRGQAFEKITEGDRTPMGWRELLVLIAGIVTVAIYLILDALATFNVITL